MVLTELFCSVSALIRVCFQFASHWMVDLCCPAVLPHYFLVQSGSDWCLHQIWMVSPGMVSPGMVELVLLSVNLKIRKK